MGESLGQVLADCSWDVDHRYYHFKLITRIPKISILLNINLMFRYHFDRSWP